MRTADTHSSGRTIRLTERIEDEVQLVFGNTNTSISNTKLQSHALVVECQQPRAKCDVALPRRLTGGELDRITNQVRDDLAEAERVADELVRDVRLDVVCEVEVVLRSTHNEGLEDAEYCLS